MNGDRPEFAAEGVKLVRYVTPNEQMKLRMLNGTHSALAFTGYLAGHETIADTIADPVFATYVRRLWFEIIPTYYAPEGVNVSAYADAPFDRYANPGIRHRTLQIGMAGSQKLPQHLLGTLRDRPASDQDAPGLSLAIAAWMRYVSGVGEDGEPIVVRDPMADWLT